MQGTLSEHIFLNLSEKYQNNVVLLIITKIEWVGNSYTRQHYNIIQNNKKFQNVFVYISIKKKLSARIIMILYIFYLGLLYKKNIVKYKIRNVRI